MEEAIFLTRFGGGSRVVHRRDAFRASKIMAERVLRAPKIEVIWNSAVVEVLGEPSMNALVVRNSRPDDPPHYRGRRAVHRDRPRSEHRDLQGSARARRSRLRRTRPTASPPRSPACSSPATSSTSATNRRSPPPVRAARPRSRSRSTSERSRGRAHHGACRRCVAHRTRLAHGRSACSRRRDRASLRLRRLSGSGTRPGTASRTTSGTIAGLRAARAGDDRSRRPRDSAHPRRIRSTTRASPKAT